MTPNELYNRTPEQTDTDINMLIGCYYNHIPEISDTDLFLGSDKISAIQEQLTWSQKVQIKYYKKHCFDGRRVWILASVWFDGSPVMIIQNAGREGDDWAERFITDPHQYVQMVKYINSLIPFEVDERDADVVNPNKEIRNLTAFYNYSLNDYFDHW